MHTDPYLEMTRSRLARIWWSLAWRTVAVTYGTTLILGMLTAGLAGGSSVVITILFIGLWALTVPLSIWVLGTVLKKRFRDFSIRLVP